MPLSNITTAMQSILAGVTGVGNVYSYRRWAADEATFRKLFTESGTILAWTITRESTRRERFEQGRYDYHTMIMRGFLGTKDSTATELTFQNLVETINNVFEANTSLMMNGTANAIYAEAVQVRKVDYVKYGEYLCHFAELEMVVTDVVSP